MPGKSNGEKPSLVRTVYELWYIRRLNGIAETALPPTHYDELERFAAEADYQAGLRQAAAEIGTERIVTTDNAIEASGFVDRIVVELRSRKVGAWASPAQVVFGEVFLDESRLSPKARAIRDGIMAMPIGERSKLFEKALQGVGNEGTPGRDSDHGRVCRKHNRWVGRMDTDDRCWRHAWQSEEAAV